MIRRWCLLLAFVVAPVWADGAVEVLPKQAAIASARDEATAAGMEVLAMGGNAFDAAIAVSATLGLVEPESSGLGGGGFLLLHDAKSGRDIFIDARERAPLAAHRDMYLGADGRPLPGSTIEGALSAAIPGLPAGLDHVARHYGRLPLAKSLAPAIRLARQGWMFGGKNRLMMVPRLQSLQRNEAAARLLLRKGAIPAEGARMRNEDYARSLEVLARSGADGFYRGDYARRLVAGVRAGGGIWSERDLAEYKVVERTPLRTRHRGFDIVTAPPPSSGGIALAVILNILSGYDYPALDVVPRTHLVVEAMRRAYRDRALYLGDPDFVEVPVQRLISADYAAGLRAGIHPERATPSDSLPGVPEPPARHDTSHFSVIDTEGNLAAVTQTVNLPYASAFVVPGTGFLLNNEMDDFSVQPGVPNAFGLVGAAANAIEPGKRPLSSMAPTFLIGKDRVSVLGTPGGSRIPTMVLLGLFELMAGRDAQAAVSVPRYHHQYLPDKIFVEVNAFTPAQAQALQARGFVLEGNQEIWGNMHVAQWRRDSGKTEIGLDRRWRTPAKQGGSVFR